MAIQPARRTGSGPIFRTAVCKLCIFVMANIFFYLITDQPTTSPICGASTDIISGFYHTSAKLHINQCMDSQCKYVFFEEDE